MPSQRVLKRGSLAAGREKGREKEKKTTGEKEEKSGMSRV